MKSLLIIFTMYSIMLHAQPFEEKALDVGIRHSTFDANMMAGGVAVIDYNNDGLEDLYFIGGTLPDHLYRNNGDETFTDVSAITGIDKVSNRYTMGVVGGDLDNDGFTDLFVTTYKGDRSICLRNIGGVSFEDVTIEAGFFGTKWSTMATMGDIDLDGDLDVYVSNFVDFDNTPFFNHITVAEPNFLYENLGNWKFDGRSDLLDNVIDGCTLVSCFTDIDNDSDPDLFVINDFGGRFTPNQLYINEAAQLEEQGASLFVDARMDGMGIAAGDINDDGLLDYYMTDIGDNLLYEGSVSSAFEDVSLFYNVNDGTTAYSWGAFFADINNDSHIDLYVAKGSISESDDYQSNRLYLYNDNRRDFIDATEAYGLSDGGKGRGAVYADLNNDGWLDIVVNSVRIREDNLDTPLVYFNRPNNSTSGWLMLRLEGVSTNRSAYGAHVVLHSGNRQILRELQGGSSYQSQHSNSVHFGLGDLQPDSITIAWPGGKVQALHDITPNTSYKIVQDQQPEIVFQQLSTATKEVVNATINQLKLSPNPAQDQLHLSFNSSKSHPRRIRILNLYGKELRSLDVTRYDDIKIVISDLSNGVYLVESHDGSQVFVQQFVIIR